MKKYSLHIGINQADPEHYGSALEALASCHNDALAMQSLAKHLGFVESQLLLDKEACADPVKESLQEYSKRLKSGDLLLISYSGHGGCMPNLNEESDEEAEGDQTWCLYDRQLIDDELAHIWPLFAENVQILVFLDACHSGSAVRDHSYDELAKEIEEEMAAFFEEEEAITKAMPSYVETPLYFKYKDLYDPIIEAHKKKPEEMKASLLLFAACQDHQQARAGKSFSYFTLAFIQVMMRKAKEIQNYPELFKLLKQQALPTQTPNELYLGKEQTFFQENLPFLLPEETYPANLGRFFQQIKRRRFL